jgi:hypothetical protein
MNNYYSTPGKYTDTRLEAVIVSLNYGDFLAETLPYNVQNLDRIVVVTGYADTMTKEVCRKWSVECVTTDMFTEGGRTFGKGPAINVGLQHLRQTGWIMQLDADIVLPLTCRNMLDKSGLQRDHIYGCERVNINSYKRWAEVKTRYHADPQFGYRYLVGTPDDLPVGANLVHKQYGYCPIGFFQLWHAEHSHKHELRYPETHGSAENEDVTFATRWPRHKRSMLPTVRVFHLESEPCLMGTNWNGRKTKPFTATGEPPDICAWYGYSSS